MTNKNTADSIDYPCLIVLTPDGKEESHLIPGREATIGRDPANDICILDPLVSKVHARLIISNQSVTVVDLGSANRTLVNGRAVTQSGVKYGDELQFARTRCRLAQGRSGDGVHEGAGTRPSTQTAAAGETASNPADSIRVSARRAVAARRRRDRLG